jgi:proline iminopeptidase
MPEREGWVDWGGHRTWYRVVGELGSGKDPLLALHGGPGSTHNYFAPLERLAEDDRAVVVYDQLGCGRSDRPVDFEWSVELFRNEVQAVRDALGLERVHLLGTSWGGMLALEHALARTARLTSLILSSTLASAAEWVREVAKLRDAMPPDVVAAFARADREGVWEGPEWDAADDAFSARHFYRGRPRQEIERMKAERGKEAYRALWGPNEWTATGPLRDWDVRGRLGEIDVPTLVIRGAYDLSTEPITETLVRGIRGARLVVFEHSSHTPVLEETEAYLRVVGDFIAEAEARAEAEAPERSRG